jgi:hypothetical protein
MSFPLLGKLLGRAHVRKHEHGDHLHPHFFCHPDMLLGDVGLGHVSGDLRHLCSIIRRHLEVILCADPWKK